MRKPRFKSKIGVHVVLDTNIYRQDPKRQKGAFRALERLAKAGLLKLYVPYFIEKEFISQSQIDVREHIRAIEKSIDSLQKHILPDEIFNTISELRINITAISSRTDEALESEFLVWLNSLGAERLSIQPEHSLRVIQAYFDGKTAFKKQKSRADFPDAFIYESIYDLSRRLESIIVAVYDENFREALKKIPNISVYSTLDEVVQSPKVRHLIDSIYTNENIERNISSAVYQISSDLPIVYQRLVTIIRQGILGEIAYGIENSDDEGEANVRNVITVESILINPSSYQNYGNGEVSISFISEVDADVAYSMEKENFEQLADRQQNTITIEGESDYNYFVTENYTLKVEGMFLMKFPLTLLKRANQNDSQIRDIAERSDVTLNHLEDIEVALNKNIR